jgi:hypothetical protein
MRLGEIVDETVGSRQAVLSDEEPDFVQVLSGRMGDPDASIDLNAGWQSGREFQGETAD